MKLRVVSGKTMKVLEIEDVSQVVVYTEGGDPVSASIESPAGVIITAHAAEDDFKDHLRNIGVKPRNPVELLGG